MSDDVLVRPEPCRECGEDVPHGEDNEGLCASCAKEDEWVECECGESGWAGCDNMFTFSCKECEAEICESCSSNNLCEGCEERTAGVRTIRFG